MGFRPFLLGIPVILMVISIVMQGGSLMGSGGNVGICNGNSCAPPGSATIISCNIPGIAKNTLGPWGGPSCKIEPSCITPTPAPAWCFPFPFSLLPTNKGTYLPNGQTVILDSQQQNQGQLSTSYAGFNFGSIGASGWTVIIIVAMGIAVLAGIGIFGSGLSPEAVHILFIGGTALGIWFFLSAFDGFIFGNPNSIFSQMNTPSSVGSQGYYFGTALYVILSMMYTIGVVGLVSRGE